MRSFVLATLTGAVLLGCDGHATSSSAGEPTGVSVPVFAETQPSAQDDTNTAAIWVHPQDPAQSLILASSGTAGLEAYALDGQLVSRYDRAEIDHLDVRYGFRLRDRDIALVVANDRRSGGLIALTVDPTTRALQPISTRALATRTEVTGVCLYRSEITGRYYAFASGDDGLLQQWELFEKQGEVSGRLVRTLPIGTGAGFCAVDDAAGTLYVTEENVGIWKLAAEPEAESERAVIDLVAPHGNIQGEVKGLAIRGTGNRGYLLAVDTKPGRINVYALESGKYLGSVVPSAQGAVDAANDIEGLAAANITLSPSAPGGLLVVQDDDNDGAAGNYKLLAWQPVARALRLSDEATERDSAAPAASTVKVVEPTVETEPMEDYGDAADDPAIWVHPRDPSKSVIIGTNKKRGLHVYDLTGRLLQSLPDGRMNNVDLRQGFRLGNRTITVIAASNRTSKSLALYTIDPATRRVSNIAAGTIPTGLRDPYGLCMYRSAKDGAFYVFINDPEKGAFRQWRLQAQGERIAATPVRDFTVGSQAEGCAADDETGALYVGEEDVGLWRYSAEPDGGSARTLIDSTDGGHLHADVEGIGIYYGRNGKGYLVVSSQGSDSYVVYRREGHNEFVGEFRVVANNELGIDGSSETDGLDVTSAALGSAFPHGLFVAQDGRNISPREQQNFKFVPWERIAGALSLQE